MVMSKLSKLFGRKQPESGSEALSGVTALSTISDSGVDGLEADSFADVGVRLGEENESLRNLLIDAGRKINEFDEFKDAFIKIMEPANKALRSLEVEKSQNISLRRNFSQVRATYETLQVEYREIEKKASTLKGENERLRHELDLSRQAVRDLESTRTELTNELTSKRAEIVELERHLERETAQVRAFSEDNQTLRDQSAMADKRIGLLEADLAAARDKVVLLEDDKRSLQILLDQTNGELTRVTQRLTDTDNALTIAKTRIVQVEGTVAEIETERNKLVAAVDEANERYRSGYSALNMQVSALQARAATAEKLLAETRQNLVARTEEARNADRAAMESAFGRNKAEKKLTEMEASREAQDAQVRGLEQSRATLVERATALLNTVKKREAQLTRAEERIQLLTDRVEHSEADLQASRQAFEKRIEELSGTLERERLEHSVVEGSLEAARKDRAQLQRELTRLQATLRRGALAEEKESSEPQKSEAAATASGGVEPIIKA
jgi:crescentin